MTDMPSNGFGAAVARAQTSVVRVEAARCRNTSGTAIASDLVLTSQRALGDSDEARVTTDAGTTLAAERVGSDPVSDLTLLRVKDGALSVPELRDHTALQVGDWALALGRPGKSIRASLRIIGLLANDVATPGGGRLERYIETDRGFPEGFVGGPLIDASGALLGMNSDRVIRGADLTLPNTTWQRIVQELLAHGRVRRGYLGVATQPVRLPAALRASLSQRSGALVLDSETDGPAHKAGLTLGDVIVGLDGAQVRGPRELVEALAHKLSVAVTLQVVRGGQVIQVQVTTAERA